MRRSLPFRFPDFRYPLFSSNIFSLNQLELRCLNGDSQAYNEQGKIVNQAEAVNIITAHLKGLFPKSCPRSNRQYRSLKEFYEHTAPLGNPVSYDLDANDLKPEHPRGAMAVSTCQCGSSITLTSQGMPVFQYWSLLLWGKSDMQQKKISTAELLFHLRVVVREQVIAEKE